MDIIPLDRRIRSGIWSEDALPEAFHDLMALGHRFTGSPGEKLAQEYLSEKFQTMGLAVDFQQMEIDTYRRGKTKATLSVNGETIELDALAFAFSPSTDGILELELLHVGAGDPEDVEKLKSEIEGRATYARPRDVMRSRRAKNLAKHGAKASLFASHVDHHDGCIISVVHSGDVPPVPTVGLNKTASGIVADAISRGNARIRLEVTGETIPSTSGNLIATLEGTSDLPEIIVGGHLDSYDLCEAAMDNGAGAALMLEVARVFSGLPRPLRTLRFVYFTGEEIATTGSKLYVKERLADPAKAGMFFNVDMPAEGGLPSILQTGWECEPGYWNSVADELGHRFPVVEVPPKFSDHAPFANAGIPCIWVQATNTGTRGPAAYEHTILDTTEKVDMLELREATMLAARILLRLANAETLPCKPGKLCEETIPVSGSQSQVP